MKFKVTPNTPPSKAIKVFYILATKAVKDLLGISNIK